ncbi:uncharacterized protein AMSG_09921 [Thecamonas trahens ATCC 50062]|uniref:Uncharacterized protein n=1 Tax=Thecamonas trahens ATCC 50062 TaxID=461836 RepID=A0A0L0DPB8_THETB|nr:hypothetical protein AMSG_09921 [Thecamonas trahens ATCC 50062]KNC54142.1 hypothetical protein AMSG_09921 [Thecamonas trahens ATCC 50062]|eukprot:XP_013753963.1 hypothetical protein AMSG_09921 [Thecamonas trahens ATCC 50062]
MRPAGLWRISSPLASPSSVSPAVAGSTASTTSPASQASRASSSASPSLLSLSSYLPKLPSLSSLSLSSGGGSGSESGSGGGAGSGGDAGSLVRMCDTCVGVVAALDGLSAASSTPKKTQAAVLLAELAAVPHFAWVVSKLGAVSVLVHVLLASSDEHCVAHSALALARVSYMHSNAVLITALAPTVFGHLTRLLSTASPPSVAAGCVALSHMLADKEMRRAAAACGLATPLLLVLETRASALRAAASAGGSSCSQETDDFLASVTLAALGLLLHDPRARAELAGAQGGTGLRALVGALQPSSRASLEQSFKLLSRGAGALAALARDESLAMLGELVTAGALEALGRALHLALELLGGALAAGRRGEPYIAALRVTTQALALLARSPVAVSALAALAESSGGAAFESMASPAAMEWSMHHTLAQLMGFPGGLAHATLVLNDDDRAKLALAAEAMVTHPFVTVQVLALLTLAAQQGSAFVLPFVRVVSRLLSETAHPAVFAAAAVALTAMVEHCVSTEIDEDGEAVSVGMLAVYGGVLSHLSAHLVEAGEEGSPVHALALLASLAFESSARAAIVRTAPIMDGVVALAHSLDTAPPHTAVLARTVALLGCSVPAALHLVHAGVGGDLVEAAASAGAGARVMILLALASLLHSAGPSADGLEDGLHLVESASGQWRDGGGRDALDAAPELAADVLETALRALAHARDRVIRVFALEIVVLALEAVGGEAGPESLAAAAKMALGLAGTVSRHVLFGVGRVLVATAASGGPGEAVLRGDRRAVRAVDALEASHYADLRGLGAELRRVVENGCEG